MTLTQGVTGSQPRAARVAALLAGAFVALLIVLHFLEPEFDPSRRMISEYETGRVGWLMTLAFFCWGGSVFALLIGLWPWLRGIGGWVGRVWFVLIGTALFGAGIFITNAATDTTPSTANTLHGLCGAFVIFSFPIAAIVVAVNLARRQDWITARVRLLWATVLVWVGLLAFFGTIVILSGIDPTGGSAGWPNRFMVIAYATWVIIVARSKALVSAASR